MKKQYDVIVVGAGLAGCFAAKHSADHGLRVALCEKDETISERPFVEYLLERDIKNLELNASNECFECNGIITVTGSKIAFDTDYPGGLRIYFTKGTVILDKLRSKVCSHENIDFFPCADVVELIRQDGVFCGATLQSGEALEAPIVILSTGLHDLDRFSIKRDNAWPVKVTKFNKRTKVTAKIPFADTKIAEKFKNKSWWFYKRNSFDYHSLYPFEDHAVCESCLVDVSINELQTYIRAFLTEHPIVTELLNGCNTSDIILTAKEFSDFGVKLPIVFPGLIIAGDAMNLTSPYLIQSIYPSLLTGIQAGETVGKLLGNGGTCLDTTLYEKNLMESLIEIKDDFQIVQESYDQLSAIQKGVNNMITNFQFYFPEIRLSQPDHMKC